jgi:hypothetical protein
MDEGIPGTSGEFLRRVSSRAYGMRRHLMESLDSITYDGNGSRVITPVHDFPCPCCLDLITFTVLGFSKLA